MRNIIELKKDGSLIEVTEKAPRVDSYLQYVGLNS